MHAFLSAEGFEPYLDQLDITRKPNMLLDDFRIKPSTSPEIRKKIEKRAKEMHKEFNDHKKEIMDFGDEDEDNSDFDFIL
jgi:hypothetical protein